MRFTSVSVSLGKGDLIITNVYDDQRPIMRIGDVAVYLDDDLSVEGMAQVAMTLKQETDKFVNEIIAYVTRERDKAKAVVKATAFIEDSE